MLEHPTAAAPIQPVPARTWWTAIEAAQYASVCRRTIYESIARGELKAARIGRGRSVRLSQAYVDEWLHSRATAPAA